MNQIAALIRERRTIQKFSNEPVPMEDLKEALELALWAPNHHLTFAVKFTLIGPRTREKVVELAVKMKSQGREIPAQVRDAYAAPWSNPAHLVVVRQVLAQDEKTRVEDYAFIASGLQNASLFLWSRGVGCKWSTAKLIESDEFYDWLGVDQRAEKIVGVFMVGHDQVIPETPQRPPLEGHFAITD